MKIARESLGWYAAGIICTITGALVYSPLPGTGIFYMELGIIALILGAMAVKLKIMFIKVFLKDRARELLKDYQ